MKYAAVIENRSGTWHLTFPDAPAYSRTTRVANSLLAGIEERLFEALHEHIAATGDLPAALHDGGLVIQVRPLDAARLALTRALHQRGATSSEAAASLLAISGPDAADIFDPYVWVEANALFRYLESLDLVWELSFEDFGIEAPRSLDRPARPARKKRGRPKART